MSWLGVNLNEGLNSIKGQLSTITRSVLSEDLDEIDGDESQMIVPRDRIKELEALCQLQKHELDESRRAREEVEERLQATHLATANQTAALRSQLQQTQTELQELREGTSEWVWDAGDGGGGAGLQQQKFHQQHQQQQQEFARQEQLNLKLSRRVEELEAELEALKHTSKHPSGGQPGEAAPAPTSAPAPASSKSEDDEASRNGRDSQEVLQQEKAKLQDNVSFLQAQLQAAMQETKMEADQVNKLREQCLALENENQCLLKNLEELDTQHQAAIEQILKKKCQALEEAQAMRESHNEMTQLLAQAQADKQQQEKQFQCLVTEKQLHAEQLLQLEADKQKMEQQLHNLQIELHTKSSSVEKLEGTIQELKKERDELYFDKAKLDDELKIVREREQLQCSLLEEKNKEQEELLELHKKYEEEHSYNKELQAALGKLKIEVNEVKVSKTEIGQSYELSEKKRREAEEEVTNINQHLASLMNKMSDLSLTSKESKEENDEQRKVLEKKLSASEIERNSLEQQLRNSARSLEDAMASNEILESRLQANTQELTIAKTSLSELEAKLRQADGELAALRKTRAEEVEEMKKILSSHNQCNDGGDEGNVRSLGRLLSQAVWQRDTLEHHVSSLTHQLREKTDLITEAEMARSELERECEDLRDQLEEVQKGVRPPPEGSCRGLPTIEEEDAEGGDVEGGAVTEEEHSDEKAREAQGVREVEEGGNEPERLGEIQALHAQVDALSEARGNLETEVASLRGDRESLIGQLRQAEGRTGNLVNLETEAAALRSQKQSLEMQIESLSQEMDLATVTLQDERDTLRDHMSSLTQRMELMQAEMTLSQHERESIGQQLLAQYALVEEKNATIKLLEGELEGLKSTLREKLSASSATESEEIRLQEELNSVKSQLIYKDDKIDALSQTIDQFAEIFEIKAGEKTNEIFRQIKGRYSALENSIKEKEEKISELAKLNANLHEELEFSKKQITDTAARESSELTQKEGELSLVKDQLEKSEMEIFQLREKVEEMMGDVSSKETNIQKLQGILELSEAEKNDALTKLKQTNEELMDLRESLGNLQSTVAAESNLVAQLQKDKEELKSQEQGTFRKLSQALKEKDHLLEEKQARLSELQCWVEEFEREKVEMASLADSENKSLKAEFENVLQEKNTLVKQLENAETMRKQVEADLAAAGAGRKEAEAGQEAAVQQTVMLQGERDQLIAAITQKHQESVSYHAEIQRLSQVLEQMKQQKSEEQAKLRGSLAESEAALTEVRAQMATLREQQHGLTTANSELQKNAAESIMHKTEILGLRKEIEALKVKLSSLEGERDQLRVANSHFNTQYQDQAKELSTVRERESRLSAECERLRQHLVAVEETYTAEALKAEEREATLRTTLAKMEEKLANHSTFYTNANHRASVQVETLQDEVRDITAQRDDAIHRLHAAEEVAHTTQQSLTTLQQVLEDFQKNQSREISEATERVRRQLEDEQARTASLTTQFNALKSQLGEAQGGLAAAGRLGEQLARKEQMITALRAQVTSQEEVAKRARDEVACLRTSSEGKVEKQLVRNLLVGYFATPGDKRSEVLRVIAEVLDFSGEERARTGLDTQGSSWLTSIANFLAPPASNVRVTSKVDVLDHTSLSQAFIRFLEDESSPRPQARLPAVQMAQQTTEKAEKKAQAKAQAASKINPFVSTGEVSGYVNSDSRTSSPLLAAASTTPSLPTITPSITPVPDPTPAITTTPAISTTKYLSNLLTPANDDENANKQVLE